MTEISLITHAPGAPGLRLFGLGPNFLPNRGIYKLKDLLNNHAFWASKRSAPMLRKMLANSSVIISLWKEQRMIGFGRATSDKVYRAVLWDVVIANDLQGLGLGKLIIEALVESPSLKNVEKIYLMTTNSSDFYLQMGFKLVDNQKLLINRK